MVASNNAEKAMEIVLGCSYDDTMSAYKVQKILRDVKFRHLELRKLRESLQRVIEIFRESDNKVKFNVMSIEKNYIRCVYVCSTVERFKLACLAKLTWGASYFQILNKCTINGTFSVAAIIGKALARG